MSDYNEYIGRLKAAKTTLDYDRVCKLVKSRIVAQPVRLVWRAAFSLAGAVAVFLIGFALYANLDVGGDETIASYLNEGQAINGSLLMTYVFGD